METSLKMETVRLQGMGQPMLMHSDTLANPLAPETIAHKILTSKRKKTDEDYWQIAYSEWKNSMYWDDEIGVYLPVFNVRKSLIEGARLRKLGKQIERGVYFDEEKITLKRFDRKKFFEENEFSVKNYPKTQDDMWRNHTEYADARTVVVNRSKLYRYRPCFRNWTLDVKFLYDIEVITLEDIIISFEAAGQRIGIGDFRPLYGKYLARLVENEGG